MKNQILRLLSLLILVFISATSKAADSKIYIDYQLAKDRQYLLVNQKVRVVVESKKGDFVSGKLGASESPLKKLKSITLEHKVTKADLKLGYIISEVYFTNTNGKVIDSFIKVIPVTTQKEIAKKAKESDEEQVKRVLKELGLDKAKCDSLLEN